MPRDRTGRDSQSKYGTGHGTGQGFDILPRDGPGGFLTACPVPSQKIAGQPRDRWEKRVKKLEKLKKKKKELHFFLFYIFFVPGQRSLSRDRTGLDSQSKCGMGRGTGQVNFFCPGTKGQENVFVLGQRDNGTSRPGLSRDVPSLGNPTQLS